MESEIKRIAIFTSGGDAPGMNAAIRAVVRNATYHDLHVFGIRRGYDGMIDGNLSRLETQNVANIIHRGGTILKTARSKRFYTSEGRKQAFETLVANDIDACIAIGGDGTFTGATTIYKEHGLPIVGIPGTIDNDLYGTDFSIGFDTAVNTAVEAVDKIRDTADSHNRLFFVEVMGRHAGYIALNTAIGSGAGGVLIPEKENTLDGLLDLLKKNARRKKLFSIVIVAEGNAFGGATDIAREVRKAIDYYDVKVTVIGHLQRGGSPTAADRVLASRLGFGAVNALLQGNKDIMVGIKDNNLNLVPFDEAIKNKKRPDDDLLKMAEILSL